MKRGVLALLISFSLFLFPAYTYDDYNSYTDNSTYYDMSDDEFEDLLDNFSEEDIINFLGSLDDGELEYLLEEAGMTREEFNSLMDDFYEYYEYSYDGNNYFDWDDEEDDEEDEWEEDEGNSYYPEFDTEDNSYIEKPIKKDPLSSEKENNKENEIIKVPNTIGQNVVACAMEYTKQDTFYKQGGQDMARSLAIDCSGLVINCYKEALVGTNFSLPFNDTTAYNLYLKYTEPTGAPEPGDLIFMSYSFGQVDHVGIFVEIKDDNVYFIDATLNETNKNGQSVNKRYYPINDYRVISYGKMKLINR